MWLSACGSGPRRHHRSLQGELRAILDTAATTPDAPVLAVAREPRAVYGATPGSRQTFQELYEWAMAQNLAGTGNSADDIRQMRDERAGHIERVLASARNRRKTTPAAKGRGRR